MFVHIVKWVITYPEVYDAYEDNLENYKIDYSEIILDLKTTINITFFVSFEMESHI